MSIPHLRRIKFLLVVLSAVLSGAVWATWILNCQDEALRGQGPRPLGGDFRVYYHAGELIGRGDTAAIYYPENGPNLRPPFYALAFIPFSQLPYPVAAILWMLMNLGSIALGIRLLAADRWLAPFYWALTFAPVWAMIAFGQSKGLSFLLLCLVFLLWRQDRLWSAGFLASMLLYKFSLLPGLLLLWMIEWRRDWRALCALVIGGLTLASLCFAFIPQASLAYFRSAQSAPSIIRHPGFNLMSFFSLYGFWLMLLPGRPTWAIGLYSVCAMILAIGYIRFLRQRRGDRAIVFAASVCFTILATPYAFIYDWAILLLPAILIWKQRIRAWRENFFLVWLATFLSRFLTVVQLAVLPFAVQIATPALACAVIWLSSNLPSTESGD